MRHLFERSVPINKPDRQTISQKQGGLCIFSESETETKEQITSAIRNNHLNMVCSQISKTEIQDGLVEEVARKANNVLLSDRVLNNMRRDERRE